MVCLRSPTLLLRVFVLLAGLVTGCSSSSTAPHGPDAGAGCDSTIYGHCTYAHDSLALVGPSCVEFSGAYEDHQSCAVAERLVSGNAQGTYAAGPCPRGDYDVSCSFAAGRPQDAGACAEDWTVWGHSSTWSGDGIPGYPPCLPK